MIWKYSIVYVHHFNGTYLGKVMLSELASMIVVEGMKSQNDHVRIGDQTPSTKNILPRHKRLKPGSNGKGYLFRISGSVLITVLVQQFLQQAHENVGFIKQKSQTAIFQWKPGKLNNAILLVLADVFDSQCVCLLSKFLS